MSPAPSTRPAARHISPHLSPHPNPHPDAGSRPPASATPGNSARPRASSAARHDPRRRQPDHRGNHRPIAVSPKNRALDPKRIQHQQSLLGCPAMKIQLHRPRKSRRVPITRSIRNHEPDFVQSRNLTILNLTINGIHPITPPAMQKHHRPPVTHIPIVNLDRPNSSRMRRVFQFQKRHGILDDSEGAPGPALSLPKGSRPSFGR